jgi:hypothetical protein
MTAVKSDALKIVPVARLVSLWWAKVIVCAAESHTVESWSERG